jgi:hypothetical protein
VGAAETGQTLALGLDHFATALSGVATLVRSIGS